MNRVFRTKTGTKMLVVIVFACLGFPSATLEAASSRANLESAADEAYERILAIFQKVPPNKCDPLMPDQIECNYWHLGNAFDTVIDYLRRNRSKARAFAKAVITKYDLTSITNWPCWYDDYGWWAVAAQRALQHRGLWVKDQRRRFEEIAAETWTNMQPGLSVWDFEQETFRSYPPDGPVSQEPKFDGGIWNYFWTTKSLPNVCQTPCDPTDFDRVLCGRQNTVTNGLYLVAAAVRAEHTRDPYYLQAAMREQNFLDQWFDPILSGGSSKSLLYPLDPSNLRHGPAVVRERVSTYADGHEDQHFEADLIWAGDQGLILGGTVRLIEAVRANPERETLLNLAKRITDGVQEYLVDPSDGVHFFPWSKLQNPTPANIGDPPGNDPNDYSAGIGVYMRYLLQAYKTNREMRQHLQDTRYPELVRQFAQNFAAKDQGLCYPKKDSCDDLVRNTNKLAALVAALGMRQH